MKDGKYTMGSSKDASVRGQQKGAAASFKPAEVSVKSSSGPKANGTQAGPNSSKGYSPPPQKGGGKADKVSGTAGKNQPSAQQFGTGKKLGNHYSNS